MQSCKISETREGITGDVSKLLNQDQFSQFRDQMTGIISGFQESIELINCVTLTGPNALVPPSVVAALVSMMSIIDDAGTP